MKRFMILYSLMIVVVMTLITSWALGRLPDDNIPIHWGIDGAPDRFGTREDAQTLLSIMPGVAVFVAISFVVIPFVSPLRENLVRSSSAYHATWFGTLAVLLVAHAGTSWLMTGGQPGAQSDTGSFVRLILGSISVLFLVLGNFMPKTRQNWFIGIRTPWTLSSELAWEKTHRLGGRLMILTGLAGLIGMVLLPTSWLVGCIVVLTAGSMLTCVVYSFLVWRRAGDKRESPDYLV